jgi:cytochrome b5
VTSYLDEHPGGPEIILVFAGKDADGIFADIGHSTTAKNLIQRYEIGRVKT